MSIGFDTLFKKIILIHYSTTTRITYIGVDGSILPMVGHYLLRGPDVQRDGGSASILPSSIMETIVGRTMVSRPSWV